LKVFIRVLLICLITVVSGCLATTDLLVDGSQLTQEERSVVRVIADKTAAVCIHYQSEGAGPNAKKISGDMKIHSAVTVKRLFTSLEGWYRAEAWTAGVIDSVFYNARTGGFVCGQKGWETYAESGRIAFVEAGVTRPSLSTVVNTQPAPQPASAATTRNQQSAPSVEQRLRDLKSLFDKGLITKEQHDQKRSEIVNSL